MLTLLRNWFVLFALTLTASAASEENITRQLDVAFGGKLIVDVDFGTIDVVAGADDKVVLEAHRKIDFRDEAKEKEYFAAAPVTISKDGNVVTVRAHYPNSKSLWNFGHSETNGRYSLHVPKRCETDLDTAGGDISVTGIAGNLKAKTSGGKLVFKQLEGTLAGKTSGGPVALGDCRGPIEIQTSGGDITATNGTGPLKARTSGGRIDVRDYTGDTDVKTSGGDLVLEKITGKITGKTSGGAIRATVLNSVTGDVELETSAGNIDIALPSNAAIDIVARTSAGRVTSQLPVEVSESDEEHLRGKLNGGGKSVTLRTSAGNITIKPASEIAGR